jgi:hypothetical protein
MWAVPGAVREAFPVPPFQGRPQVDALTPVLQLLDAAGYVSTSKDGRIRWGLDAADVCVLLELGHELAVDADASNWLYQELQRW